MLDVTIPNHNTYTNNLGSMIHTGHGDINEDKCWGYVDRIEEIYLTVGILSSLKHA